MNRVQQRVIARFEEHFGQPPAFVVRAPGRVNLIGEHTDYNEGFVLPMAIDRAVWVALRPRADRRVHVESLDFDTPIDFSLDELHKGANSPAEYVKGVAWAVQQAGHILQGWEGVMQGDVPIGAGLSSSAALELAIARAFQAASGYGWDGPRMALLAQQAENQWVGVQCGIMDQMISAVGLAGHALLIDCRTLESTPAPLPPETVVVVLDTNTRRGLVDSSYNERRAQCEAAAAHFGQRVLRDVTMAQLEAASADLDRLIVRRARHVISENARTLRALEAMRAADPVQLGLLMNASHVSLRDDFEVSSPALNQVVEVAGQHEACFGARMTGAGFGGCAVALVRAAQAEAFVAHVEAAYGAASPFPKPTAYVCQPSDGAQIVSRS
ncbi:MAG: galactokinase [Anaerolineae bacterium]|nr:galactokinase [Anaerolineae bacterium]MDW8171969.1 galactokinase [Anaerolineae bacterium]